MGPHLARLAHTTSGFVDNENNAFIFGHLAQFFVIAGQSRLVSEGRNGFNDHRSDFRSLNAPTLDQLSCSIQTSRLLILVGLFIHSDGVVHGGKWSDRPVVGGQIVHVNLGVRHRECRY